MKESSRCPFCGKSSILVGSRGGGFFSAECGICGARGPVGETKEWAAKAFRSRGKLPEPLSAEELRRAVLEVCLKCGRHPCECDE